MECKARILYLHAIVDIGGGEIALLEILKGLDRERFEPFVALPRPGALAERIQQLGIAISFLPLYPLKARNPFPFLWTVYRLWRFMARVTPDLLHANSDLSNQYGVWAARLVGIPAVCHARLIPTSRSTSRSFLCWADRIIAVSQAVGSPLLAYGLHLDKVTVIYDSVDTREFSPGGNGGRELRARWGVADDVFLVGIVGRICRAKGHHVLLQAWPRVIQHCDWARLVIVGYDHANEYGWAEDDYLRELHAALRDERLAQRVFFSGFYHEIRAVYEALDLVVMPTVGQEGFGKVQIESMAMQKPVIASRIGASPEIIEDGVSGLLVPPGEAEALAQAILRLCFDRELAGTLGRNGRRRVEERFSAQVNLSQIQALYEELLAKQPNRHEDGKV